MISLGVIGFPKGVGLFAKAALLNHSCHPNCVATFHGTTLQITATETIQPGDELTISYTELLRPSYKRKEDLWEQYGFDCQCRNCVCCDENDAMMNAIRCQRWGCQGKVPVGTAAGEARGGGGELEVMSGRVRSTCIS